MRLIDSRNEGVAENSLVAKLKRQIADPISPSVGADLSNYCTLSYATNSNFGGLTAVEA